MSYPAGLASRMIFILAVALTGGSMLTDKGEGTMERCLVAGVNMFEILLSHIITEFVIMFGQTLIILMLSFVVFDLQNVGPWACVIFMSVLQGINGMSLGKSNCQSSSETRNDLNPDIFQDFFCPRSSTPK